MDAAAISSYKMAQVQQQWAIGFTENVKEVMEQQGQALVEMMEQNRALMERSVHPELGNFIDIRV